MEDMFEKEEYLGLFNDAFKEHKDLSVEDLNANIQRVIVQINSVLSIQRFNHYRPANTLARKGVTASFFQDSTLSRFEQMFQFLNGLFA